MDLREEVSKLMHILYYISITIFAGIAMGKLASTFKLPNVTGYLFAGVLLGPSVLCIVPKDVVPQLSIIPEIALSFIAYTIGSELNLKFLKKTGTSIIVITILEALGAVFAVSLGMIFIFKQNISMSIVLGSIAASTAPAATIMVIRQYQAKGPLVDTLIPVVAMDDAIGIIAFGIAMAIAQSLSTTAQNVSLVWAMLQPVIQILLALLIGFIIGIGLIVVSKKTRGENTLLSLTIAAVFLASGIAESFGLSALLCSMMVGATVSNIATNSHRVISVIDRVTAPIFIAFFAIAALDLELAVIGEVGLIGVAYVIFRIIGKMLGSYAGARMTHAPEVVQKYLGFTLLTQAGVAIGLAIIAEKILSGIGSEIKTIILFSTLIYELIGPVIAKTVLVKAGEITIEE